MVFCETKREADELAVSPHIKVETHVMHGDVPQDKREMVLKVRPASTNTLLRVAQITIKLSANLLKPMGALQALNLQGML